MQFEYFIDHTERWRDDEDYSADFKQFVQHIQTYNPVNVKWEERVFPQTRPIPQHLVKLSVATPFNTHHYARLRFKFWQPPDNYNAVIEGYFFSYKLDHDAFLAPGMRSIKGNLNANDPIVTIELSALTYDNAVTQWLNRVYLKVIDEK